MLLTCLATDCNKTFAPKTPHQKYCSDRCRWRSSKQSLYKERKQAGLCPQCGGKMTGTESASYCKDCQNYFKKLYKNP